MVFTSSVFPPKGKARGRLLFWVLNNISVMYLLLRVYVIEGKEKVNLGALEEIWSHFQWFWCPGLLISQSCIRTQCRSFSCLDIYCFCDENFHSNFNLGIYFYVFYSSISLIYVYIYTDIYIHAYKWCIVFLQIRDLYIYKRKGSGSGTLVGSGWLCSVL